MNYKIFVLGAEIFRADSLKNIFLPFSSEYNPFSYCGITDEWEKFFFP